jgi:hypothetical protein
MKYVVVVEEAEKATGLTKLYRRYLCAIAYQSYEDEQPCRSCSDVLAEAFVFTERAAAELAAVWVGGEILDYESEQADVLRNTDPD